MLWIWLQPATLVPADGSIYLVNSSDRHVSIDKSAHLAEVRNTVIAKPDFKPICNKAVHDDKFQFIDLASTRHIKAEYLDQIQLDPDNVLSPDQRDIFNKLHLKSAKLFTPQPGKYNGARGYIGNKLQFSTQPPPNSRTRIPNYSPPMNSILAEKMDTLEEWGGSL